MRWNRHVSQIPNREGLRIVALVADADTFCEVWAAVFVDGDGRHFLSTDGTIEKQIAPNQVHGWRRA